LRLKEKGWRKRRKSEGRTREWEKEKGTGEKGREKKNVRKVPRVS